MKAVRIHQHGGVDEFRYEDAPNPVPGPDEVLISVRAAGVNPADHKHRSGIFKDFVQYNFPLIIGYDVAGEVIAIGDNVTELSVGSRVFAMLNPVVSGGYGELVTTAASNCGIIPDGMDFDLAAAIPCPALTGTQFVEERLKPKAGDLILVTGATGMVARFAVRAAKDAGARVVAAVRSDYADEARALGADFVVMLGEESWNGERFDAVIDTVGGDVATDIASKAKAGAPILTAATTPLDAARLPSLPEFISVHPDGCRLGRLGAEVQKGVVPVEIRERLPFSQAAKAHSMIESGGVRGKIVLIPDRYFRE